MGHGFGSLWKYRGIVTYRLSPFELKAFGGTISHGIPNSFRRLFENIPYIAPPMLLAYIAYDQTKKKHQQLMRKNPADYENDK